MTTKLLVITLALLITSAYAKYKLAVCTSQTYHNVTAIKCTIGGQPFPIRTNCKYQALVSVGVNNYIDEPWNGTANKKINHKFNTEEKAQKWQETLLLNSTTKCYYNTKILDEVVFKKESKNRDRLAIIIASCVGGTALLCICIFGFFFWVYLNEDNNRNAGPMPFHGGPA